MKKYTKIILTSIVALAISGCAAISSWFSNINWGSINNIVAPVVQSTAKTTIYLVCEKNSDLKPVFNAVGNGILLAIANDQYDATQIETYIKNTLGDDVKYYPVIKVAMQTLIDGYITFYKTNWKATDDETEKANVEAVFSKYLSALATGIIDGAKMSADEFKTLASANQTTFDEVCKMQVIE